MEFSREFGLTANVIEKDYVLGWVLAGIFNHVEFGSDWIFKGGTCLKNVTLKPIDFLKILILNV
jgi:predicted nucleotidyltransferase component of viral defense system